MVWEDLFHLSDSHLLIESALWLSASEGDERLWPFTMWSLVQIYACPLVDELIWLIFWVPATYLFHCITSNSMVNRWKIHLELSHFCYSFELLKSCTKGRENSLLETLFFCIYDLEQAPKRRQREIRLKMINGENFCLVKKNCRFLFSNSTVPNFQ